MADAFSPVRPGDPLRLPAEAYNAMLEAAKAHRSRAMQLAGEPRPRRNGNVIMPVRNISGVTLPRHAAVGIHDVVTRAGEEMLIYGKPLDAGHIGQWVVTTEPIAPSDIGLAVVAGVALAKVDVRSASHRFADVVVVAGQAKLASRLQGHARMLWVSGTSGQQSALLLFPADTPSGVRYGKLAGPLNCNDPNASATMHVLALDGTTVVETVTVHPSRGRDLGVILVGMRVEAVYDPDQDRYVVVAGGKAKLLSVTATDSFTPTTAEVSVRVDDWDIGDDPDPTDSGLLALNELGFEGAPGSKWFAEYLPQLDRYRLYQGVCPEVPE